MYVVIFRARLKAGASSDPEYTATAAELRSKALGEFGCTEFVSSEKDGEELAISFWPTEDHVRRWRAHAEHQQAQERGRSGWYERYSVQVTEVRRHYSWSKL
eukprot:Hpha_TRINITY_DN20162_c0_g1::TRINITY_DN20162_c0_g1_i1::g.82485::m.82485